MAKKNKAFYEKYYPVIKKVIEERGTSVLPETAMAQFVKENGLKDFNPDSTGFGIKAWRKGKKQANLKTKEYIDGKYVEKGDQNFELADSFEDAVNGYVDFLEQNPRYSEAISLGTPEEQLTAIHGAGYAGDTPAEDYLTDKGGGVITIFNNEKETLSVINSNLETNPNAYRGISDYKGSDYPSLLDSYQDDDGKFVQGIEFSDGTVKEYTSDKMKNYDVVGHSVYELDPETNYAKKINTDSKEYEGRRLHNEDIYLNALKDFKSKTKDGYLSEKDFVVAQSVFEEAAINFDESSKRSTKKGAKEGLQKSFNNLESVYYVDVLAPHFKQENDKAIIEGKNNLNRLKKESNNPNLSIKELQEAKKNYNTELRSYNKDYSQRVNDNKKIASAVSRGSVENFGSFNTNLYAELDQKDRSHLSDIAIMAKDRGYDKFETDTPKDDSDKYDVPDKGNQVIDSEIGLTGKEQEAHIAKKTVDLEALQAKIDLNDKELAEAKAQAPLDVAAAEEQDDTLSNALGYGSDVARGLIGLSGATQKIPEYKTGEAFNEYVDDARRFKDQGLTSAEEAVRKQRAERAYSYDVQNVENLSGGASGVALANLGRSARGLQDSYKNIALEDSALKRQGRAEFARAALTDEETNRQQFQDKFKISMANKEAGAGLVRDAYTNLNNRADFNKQYGKGSQQYAYQQELTKSMKTNRELLKRGRENREGEYNKSIEEDTIDLKSQMKKEKERRANA